MIELRNISKFYSSEGNMAVGIQNISLSYDIGEFVAITGESGSGKSTLLSVISGLDSYEEGEMLINGQSTSDYTREDFDRYRNQMVGFVFQNYNLIDSFSVLENVMIPLLAKGIKRADAKKDALAIIEKVGLKKRIHSKASKLSGGEKQRTVIARALASGAPIIACDEPTGNLDSQTSKEILALINEIRENRLILVVTHDYDAVKQYCTRHTVLKDGHVAEDRVLVPKGPEPIINAKIVKNANHRNLFYLSATNVIHTPKRTLLSLLMATVTSLAILSIIGGFIQASQQFQKIYSNPAVAIYPNQAANRIVAYPAGNESESIASIIGSDDVFIDQGNLISDADFTFENGILADQEENSEAWQIFSSNISNLHPDFSITDKMSLVAGRMPTGSKEFAFLVVSGQNYISDISAVDRMFTDGHWNLKISDYGSYYGAIYVTGSTCVGLYTIPDQPARIAFIPSATLASTIHSDFYDYCKRDENVDYVMSPMKGLVDVLVDGVSTSYLDSYPYGYVYDNDDSMTGTVISKNNVVICDSYYQDKNVKLKLYNKIVDIPSSDIVYHSFSSTIITQISVFPILFSTDYAKVLLADTGARQSIFVESASALTRINDQLLAAGYESYRGDVTSKMLNFNYIFSNLANILLTLLSFVGYLALGTVTYLVTRIVFMLIYQNKKKDYAILETLGMSKANLRFINRTETSIIFIASYLIASITLMLITDSPYSLGMIAANPLIVVISLGIIFIFAIFIAMQYEKKLFALTVNKVLRAGDFLD